MLLVEWYTVANHANHYPFDHHRLFVQIDLYGLKFIVFRQQPDHRTILPVALDGHFIIDPGDNNLPAAYLGRPVDGDKIAVKDARIPHTHTLNAQQVMRLGIE